MQYYLSLEDINLCKKKQLKTNQLVFGLMLCYFKQYFQFPSNKAGTANISVQLLFQVAKHLDIDPVIYNIAFDWNTRSIERYRQEIRQYLGYRIASTKDLALTINYLVDNLLPRNLSDAVLLEQTRTYFIKNKIEITSTKQLNDCISLARQQFEQQLFGKIFDNLTQENIIFLDRILSKDTVKDSEIIGLSELKEDIAGAKIKNIQGAIDKINLLNQIKLPNYFIESVDRKVLLKYYERIMAFIGSVAFVLSRFKRCGILK